MADIVASGDWWTFDSDGTLDVFCEGSMPAREWGSYASSIRAVTFGYGVTSICASAFRGTRLSNALIPDGVTSIGAYAFQDCEYLTNVVVPDSVSVIGNKVFYGCSLLKTITLPDRVTSIGSNVFSGCSKLTNLVLPYGMSVIRVNELSYLYALTSVTIPDSVTSIGEMAFTRCTALESVIVPDSVSSIGDSVFLHCTKLKNVSLPNTISSVPYGTFSECSALERVIIPDSVTSIEAGAFSECPALTSVVMPDSVTSIKDNAFRGCSALTSVEYNGTDEQWDAIQFGSGNEPLLEVVVQRREEEERQRQEEERRRQVNAELSRRYHSITIGAYNTWTDWRLIPTSRPVVNPPEVKTNFVEVPGADGALDFTEALDEKIHYKPREGSWEFLICHEQIDIDTNYKYHSENRWATLWHDILNAVHGKRNQIILMDEWREGAEDNRFYVGRVWLNEFISDPSHSRIVFDYNLEPFRYLTTEDAQNRVNGVL